MYKSLFLAACACMLFFAFPRAGSAGCVQGDCKNGPGVWVWDSGNSYEGNFANSKRTGRGTFTFSNGDKYTGDFLDGKFHGHGKYTYADGEIYDGQWKSGKMAGKGVLKRTDGTKQEGDYRDGAVVDTFNANTEELKEPDADKYPKGHMEKLMADPPEKKEPKKPVTK